MSRLIDADKIEPYEHLESFCNNHAEYAMVAYMDDIDALPTVDAVPVVRCKDCKYWKIAEGVNLSKKVKFCTYHIGHQYARHDEDFCSRGERKDGEQA